MTKLLVYRIEINSSEYNSQKTIKMKKIRKQFGYEDGLMPFPFNFGGKNQNLNLRFIKSTMLKAVFFLLVFLGTSTLASAQFDWGVKLGANASTQSEIGNICDDTGLKAGMNLGLLGRYHFNDWLALKSGIDYQTKGKKCDLPGNEGELKNDLDYLILPLKAEFSASEKVGFKNHQRLFFATGPYFGYLLNAEETLHGKTTDLKSVNDFDFGWTFELGMEFPVFNKNAIQVSLSYDMGFKEIVTESKMHNKSASLNLGFLF